MAKRKKAAPKKAGKNKPPKGKPRTRNAPASQGQLPGTEQIRNRKLDRLCESIGNAREEKNRLAQEELGDSQAALTEMLENDIHAYVHMGVRLTAKKGVDRLGITLVKDKTQTGVETGHDNAATDEPSFGEDTAVED